MSTAPLQAAIDSVAAEQRLVVKQLASHEDSLLKLAARIDVLEAGSPRASSAGAPSFTPRMISNAT